MELNDLIPDNSENWLIGKFLFYRKLEKIPVCFIENDIVYIFLDAKIIKAMFKLIKFLLKKNIIFYFTTPELSNPKGIENYHDKVITHYLRSYSNIEIYRNFKKIDFDLISNMVKWTETENCFDLVKKNYESVLKKVNRKSYNYYSKRDDHEYSEEIRDEFNSLYRDIQINKIII